MSSVCSTPLREFRLKLGITKIDMSMILGYTLSMYEKVESGRAGASFKFIQRFKIAFPDASIESIFFSKNQQHNC